MRSFVSIFGFLAPTLSQTFVYCWWLHNRFVLFPRLIVVFVGKIESTLPDCNEPRLQRSQIDVNWIEELIGLFELSGWYEELDELFGGLIFQPMFAIFIWNDFRSLWRNPMVWFWCMLLLFGFIICRCSCNKRISCHYFDFHSWLLSVVVTSRKKILLSTMTMSWIKSIKLAHLHGKNSKGFEQKCTTN